MSTRLNVLNAVIAMTAAAVPAAEVVGLTDDEDIAARVGAGGRIVVRAGDPGEPEIDLSPLSYNWQHRIPLEVIMGDELQLDAALVKIGLAIGADRQLGGLCEWLDVDAPATENVIIENADALRGAALTLTASYATSNPLT